MKVNKTLKKIWLFCLRNYFILIFFACIAFVGLVSFYKLFISKPTFVYVKVKVGQGSWWASTQKPSMWFVNAIYNAKQEKDLTDKPIVEVQNVTYYPLVYSNSTLSQFDIYITAKLKVSKLGSGGKYNFNRSTIGVGSPIDFEFSSVQYSGTITDLSTQPIIPQYIEKTVYLTKKYAYPWEYDTIQIGDFLNNGKDKIFEVIDKNQSDNNEIATTEFGKLSSLESTELRKYISIKAKIKVEIINDQFVFAEEQIITPGRLINLATPHYAFSDFIVSKVE